MSRLYSPLFYGLFLISLTGIFMFSGCSGPEGNAADGKRWYRMHNCYACHGENGYDGRGPNIANLTMSYRSFVSRLRNAKTQVMPAYSEERINDQDAADILAFLKSVEEK